MKFLLKKKITPFLIAVSLSTPLLARANLCEEIIEASHPIYEKLNAEMVQKYPSLKNILSDPKKYKAEMEERFNQQKRVDPKHPYRFDFSDQAASVVNYMREQVPIKLSRLQQLKASFKDSRRQKSYSTVISYLQELQVELQTYVTNGQVKIDYQSFIEVSYFFSRGIGLLDSSRFPQHVQLFLRIDRSIDGYQEYSPERELELYHERQVNLFPEKSSAPGFEASASAFRKAMWNPEHLDIVMVPTPVSFNRDIFLRMMPYDIHFLGMTHDPLLSEGFLRPGGDFFIHDARHESARVSDWNLYVEKHRLSALQVQALKSKMDLWIHELNQEVNAVPNVNLREAIVFFLFNQHHDRGMPVVPSSYERKYIDITPLALHFMMNLGGQKLDFKWGNYYLPKAYQWLKTFWTPRFAEEQAILNER